MSEQMRELTTHELESVVGGVGGWAFTALNPAADTSRPFRFGFWRFPAPNPRPDARMPYLTRTGPEVAQLACFCPGPLVRTDG